jgi:hypothetical protein
MTKPSTNPRQQSLYALIADDAYAMEFQSLRQYRTALLQRLAALANQLAPTVPAGDALRADANRYQMLKKHAFHRTVQGYDGPILQWTLTVPTCDNDCADFDASMDQYGSLADYMPHYPVLAHHPAQQQAEPTTAGLVHALRQAERLLRSAGFAMTGTASSQIVAAIAEHATAAQQGPVAAHQQAAAPCKHAKCTAYYAHIECLDCGHVKTDSGWGIASNQWFKSEEEAKFYRFNGRLPQVESVAQLDGGQREELV